MTEHSVKVRPFLFPFTIDKCNLIYSEFVKVFFVRICRVFYGSEGQTQSLFFLVCNLRPYFEKVKFDVRRSLEPFKDLGGRFDPSLTALTKRSQTLSDGICVSRILSAGVFETDYGREKAYCCVTQRYYCILNCVVNLLS